MTNTRALIEATDNQDWMQRFLAARQIGERKIRGGVEALLKLLQDENEQVRIAAVESLAGLNARKALDPLVEAMADPSEWVRIKVADAIGQLGSRVHLDLLAQFLQNEEDDKVRATLVRVLGEFGGRRMASIITLYLKDPNDRVRANAVEALEHLDSPGLEKILQPLINDRSNRVKANTVKALYRLGSQDALEILRTMILSDDDWLRASAAYVFGEIDSELSVSYLIHALDDRVWFVVRNVVKALSHKGAIAIPALLQCVKSGQKQRMINALSALGEIGDPTALGSLIPLLQHEDGDIREKADEAVDQIREKARQKK